MASLSRIDTATRKHQQLAASSTPSSRLRRWLTPTPTAERNEYNQNDFPGSHMALDTDVHWEWRNPLNILPALILVLLAVALVGLVLA
jgi:hypothetical protein